MAVQREGGRGPGALHAATMEGRAANVATADVAWTRNDRRSIALLIRVTRSQPLGPPQLPAVGGATVDDPKAPSNAHASVDAGTPVNVAKPAGGGERFTLRLGQGFFQVFELLLASVRRIKLDVKVILAMPPPHRRLVENHHVRERHSIEVVVLECHPLQHFRERHLSVTETGHPL